MADPTTDTNSLVQEYRSYLKSQGQDDQRQDWEVTLELGGLLKDSGDFDNKAKQYPDFRNQYLDYTQATHRSLLGEAGAAVARGTYGTAGTAMEYGAYGLDAIGADDMAKSLSASAKKVAAKGQDYAPTIQEMGNVRTVGEGIRYGVGKIGEAIPSIAEGMAAFALGEVVAGVAVPAGLVSMVGRRALTSMIERGVVKDILGTELTETALAQTIKAGASVEAKALGKEFVDTGRAIAARMGGPALSAVNAIGLSTGEIYGDTHDVGTSTIGGVIAGIPDTVLPSYIMGKFAKGAVSQAEKKAIGGFWKRFAHELPVTTTLEAGTEGFQEAVNIAAEKYSKKQDPTINQADWDRIKEAMVGGAAGGLIGAPLAAMHAPQAKAGVDAEKLAAKIASGLDPTDAEKAYLDGLTQGQLTILNARAEAIRAAAQTEARRAAATGTTPATPVVPAGRVSTTPAARPPPSSLSPELQDARFDALTRQTARSQDEEDELTKLTALISIRPPTVPKTGGTPVVSPTVTTPVVLTREQALAEAQAKSDAADKTMSEESLTQRRAMLVKALGRDDPALTFKQLLATANVEQQAQFNAALLAAIPGSPLAAAPAAPVVPAKPLVAAAPPAPAVAAPAPAATVYDDLQYIVSRPQQHPTTGQMGPGYIQIERATDARGQPLTDAERAAAPQPPDWMPTGTYTLAQVKEAIANPPAPAAPTVSASLTPTETVVEEPLKEAQQTTDKTLGAEGVIDVGDKPTATEPAAPGAAAPAIVEAPKFQAGAIQSDSFIDFGELALGIKKRAIGMTEDIRNKLAGQNWNGVIKQMIAKLTNDGATKTGGFYDEGGSASTTRTAVAFLMPDGRVILAGLNPSKRIQGVDGKFVNGFSIQRFSAQKRDYGTSRQPGDKTAVVTSKVVEPGAKKPALFADVVASGAIPIHSMMFGGKPQQIYQEFANEQEYSRAIGAAEVKSKGVAHSVYSDVEATDTNVQPAEEAATPETKLTQLFTEKPELLETLNKLLAASGGDEAKFTDQVSGLVAAEKAKQSLTESDVSIADAFAYLKNAQAEQLALASGGPAVPALNAPVAEQSLDYRKFVTGLLEKPKTLLNLFKALGMTGGEFGDAVTKLSPKSRDVILDLAGAGDLKEFGIHVARAFQASGGKEGVFIAELRGKERQVPSQPTVTVDRTAEFNALVATLRRQGIDVTLIEQAGDERGLAYRNSVVLIFNDFTHADLEKVITLTHEVGHIELDKLGITDPAMHAAMKVAVNAAIAEVKGQANSGYKVAKNTYDNWEERLVESMAQKLAAAGIPEPSLAGTIWRAVRAAYLKIGMEIMQAFGFTASPQHVLSWFENQMLRTLGGDYDYRFQDIFRPFVEKTAERVKRFQVIDGQLIPDLYDPVTRQLRHAAVLPDSREAIAWNIARSRDVPFTGLAPNGKPSKLSRHMWQAVRSPEFLAWFGDWINDPENASKALDPETGEPLMMYHGTDGLEKGEMAAPSAELLQKLYQRLDGEVLAQDVIDQGTGRVVGMYGDKFLRARNGEAIIKAALASGFSSIKMGRSFRDGRYVSLIVEGVDAPHLPPGRNIDRFEEQWFVAESLKGPGVYTTSSSNVAGGDGTFGPDSKGGYANKSKRPGGEGARVLPLVVSVKNPWIDNPEHRLRLLKEVTEFLIDKMDNPQEAKPGSYRAELEAMQRVSYRETVYYTDPDGVEHGIGADGIMELDDVNLEKGLYGQIGRALELDPGELTPLLRTLGYDGIQHIGGLSARYGDGTPHTVFVAFAPNQVKSRFNTGLWNAHDDRISYREVAPKTDEDIPDNEATARISAAAYGEIIPIIQDAFAKFGGKMTNEAFWATMSRTELPAAIVADLESQFPGAATAKIGGEKMSTAMNDQAKHEAYSLAVNFAKANRMAFANQDGILKREEAKLLTESKRLSRLTKESRDSSVMEDILGTDLVTLLKEVSTGMDRGVAVSERAGALAGGIRAMENLGGDEVIPEEYQKVFKKIMDGNGTPIFEYLSAIAKLDLPLAGMDVAEVVKAIQDNGAKDAHLAQLATQRPLMLALASLARDATYEMDLLQLRVLKDTPKYIAIKAEQDTIMRANDASLDALEKKIREKSEAQTFGDRLAYQLILSRRAFNRHNKAIIKAQEMKLRRGHIAELMQKKADDLLPGVGVFSLWDAHDGAKYRAMQYKDGDWKSEERTLVMVGDKVAAQHGQLSADLALNQQWIDSNQDKKGSPLYNEVEKQTSVLKQYNFAKVRVMGQRFWFDAFYTPMAKTFGQLGHISGDQIEKKLIKFQEVMHTTMDKAEALAARTTEAQIAASKAAGFENPVHFFDEVLNDTIYHIETEHGRDQRAGLREGKLAARRRIPSKNTIAEDFDAKLEKFLLLHFETSTFFDNVKEEYGVYVDDAGLKDPLGGKGHLQRHSIRYGFGTSGRRLNGQFIRSVVNSMQGNGWHDGLFSNKTEIKDPADSKNTIPNPDYIDSRDDIPDPANKGKTIPNPAKTDLAPLVAKYFTRPVIEKFVIPFVEAPGDQRFFGAYRDAVKKKKRVAISQTEVRQAWEESGGDVMGFIDGMFAMTNPTPDDDSALSEYRADILRQLASHYTMVSRIAAKTMQGTSIMDAERQMHPMMDARKNDLLPPEMFNYIMFTEDNARGVTAAIAFHAAFGKDGRDLDNAQLDLRKALIEASDNYDAIPEGTRKSKMEFAKQKGWDFKFLEQSSKNKGELDGWITKLKAHVLGQEPSMGDAKWVLQLSKLNAALVMNQPKSALMNMMNVMEYPIIYRGIGPSARKATLTVAKTMARDVFADFASLFNSNLQRVIDVQRDAIAQPIERQVSHALPLKTQLSDLGPQGSFAAGGVGNAVTKLSKGIMKGMSKTFRGGINPFGVFGYISKKLDTAIATAYVETYEHIVGQSIKFFAANPAARDNPAYRITAADLGMDGGLFSDQGAFEYFLSRHEAYSIGNLEDVAREAAARVGRGERMLDRKQVTRLAIGAQNEVSTQASMNSRPLWLINNPIARMGGLLLGWPIARMGTIRNVMSTPDGRMTVASMSRALMILGGWTLPAGLAYSLLMDEYDDKILGKKSPQRSIDPIMLVPLVGPILAIAAGDRGMKNLWAAEERLARVGTFGMAGDVINSMTNIVDPTSAARDFDLNSRILIWSQFSNIRDALRNLIHQDWEVTYGSVTRPLLMAFGAGGVMQGIQITNTILQASGMDPLSSDEAAQTLRTNVGSILRTAGRDIGLSLKAGAGRASPTALSVHVQSMVTAAMSNDRVTFANAYSDAVNVAARNGEPEPQKVVLSAFKDRNPLTVAFAHKPTELEMGRLFATLTDREQRAVQEATSLFDSYAEHLAPNPWVEHVKEQQRAERAAMMPKTVKQLRQAAANAAMGF